MNQTEVLFNLAMALAVGLLIGTERGWHQRDAAEGSRPAGIRTFALIALLGGLTAVTGDSIGPAGFVAGLLLVGAFATAAYLSEARTPEGRSITTHVAMLIAFTLGAIAGRGELELAAGVAVVTTLLLGLKPAMHGWLRRISEVELMAGLKLLVMSVVLLPVLPDRGFGPWQAINPYQIWWMVVLIAGASFLGYAASRLLGPKRGIAVAGACGGIASSTAVTLAFARLARKQPQRAGLLAGGALIAWAVMFPRLLLVIAVAAPGFAASLAAPMLGAGLGLGLAAALFVRRAGGEAQTEGDAAMGAIGNPLELGSALKFGALLAIVMFAARALNVRAGESGVVLLGALSGLADVDAVSLSLAQMAGSEVSVTIAAGGVLAAVLVNTLTKAVILAGIGGRVLLAHAAVAAIAAVFGAMAGLAIMPLGLIFAP